MSKTSPDPEVELFARDAKISVVHIYFKKMISCRLTLCGSLRYVPRLRGPIRRKSPSFGTGFIIKSDDTGSIVLTADHVVRGMKLAAGDRLYVRVGVGGQHRVRQLSAHVLFQHREADVAILAVPALRNARPLNFAAGIGSAGVIAVGFADPDDLFTANIDAMTCHPHLSPGSFIRLEGGLILDEINVSHCHLEVESAKGMSGCPIVNARGAIGLLSVSDGAYSDAISNDTICQVMKAYYKDRLRKSARMITDEEVDAIVNPMTLQEVTNEL